MLLGILSGYFGEVCAHLHNTAIQACGTADPAADSKVPNKCPLVTTHVVPISVETGGPWDVRAVEFVQELGKRISEVTSEPLEAQYMFQCLSMAVQRSNAMAFKSTFPVDNLLRGRSRQT